MSPAASDGQSAQPMEKAQATSGATVASIARENASLRDQAAQRLQWLVATAEITALLASSPPGREALQLIADRTRELSGADVVWIVSGHADDLFLEVLSGVEVDMDAMRSLPLTDSLSHEVVRTGETISVPDLSHRGVAAATVPGWPDLGPAIIAPLGAAGGGNGAVALAWARHRRHLFADVDITLPTGFAEQATLALQIARAQEDQRRLAVFEERDRIARDLHDLVIQRLFAIGLGIQRAGRLTHDADLGTRLETAVADLNATIGDIRSTIFALGTRKADTDVQSAVTALLERSAATLGYRPALRVTGPVRSLVPDRVAADLLAFLEEALANVSRHAGATRAAVGLAATDRLTVTVDDNGRGVPDGVLGTAAESGLRNMRHRAVKHGGEFVVAPSVTFPTGTRVTWIVPLG